MLYSRRVLSISCSHSCRRVRVRHGQLLKCNRSQGNAVPPSTENDLKRCPTSDILWTQGNGKEGTMETVCSYSAS